MTNKINRRVVAAIAAAAMLGGWQLAQAADKIRIASTPGATADAIKAVVADAKSQGLDVELVEFTDWTVPNEAVNNGDVDLNFFQHQAFLNNVIKERGYQLKFVGLGLLQNIGIYSERHKSLADVPAKALAYSGIADRFYAMGFVSQAGRADDPKLRKFVQVFQNSAAVKQAISQQFNNDPKLYTLPW